MHGLAMPRIDYSIRPAKSVERKMLAEALSRLSKLERPDNYRYVGFGAIYFRDFSLFHKMLGIHDMKSIEHNRSEETRFWSNRPFRCVENKIQEILMARNGGLEAAQSIKYKVLFDFHYADGAKMVTVGAIIYDDTQGPAVTACAFEELSYCNPANHPFRIPTPRLTYKERRSLDASLPLGEFTQVNPKGIPSKDVAEYTKVYRYFPNFAETDI